MSIFYVLICEQLLLNLNKFKIVFLTFLLNFVECLIKTTVSNNIVKHQYLSEFGGVLFFLGSLHIFTSAGEEGVQKCRSEIFLLKQFQVIF